MGCQLLTRKHKACSDWLISTILSGALWLIKGRGSAERLQELLVFFSANGGDDRAPSLRHKLIREEVVGRAVLCNH